MQNILGNLQSFSCILGMSIFFTFPMLFQGLSNYLSVGSPIYFVVTDGFDFTSIENQNLFCSGAGCKPDSVLTQIFVDSLKPNVLVHLL